MPDYRLEEENIIRNALNGNKQAFGELVRRYERSVFLWALRRVRSRPDAEEIAQEVFLTAFRKLGQLKEGRRFGAWLRAITWRQCAIWFRTAGKVRLDAVDENHPAPEHVDMVHAGADPFDIKGLIRKLPPAMQAAAQLCLEQGLEPSAAAGMLGLKPGTLRKRFHDARARLQRHIVRHAEEKDQLDLLPRDFAKLCVCRCERALAAQRASELKMYDRGRQRG